MAKTKKKAKRGGAKKAAKKALKNARSEKESNIDPKLAKQLDGGDITGGFIKFSVIGDEVGGEVLAVVVKTDTKYGKDQLHVTLRTKTGTKGFYCPTMLSRDLQDRKVVVGDTLAVRYVKDTPTGKGAPAKTFQVFHVKGKKGKK